MLTIVCFLVFKINQKYTKNKLAETLRKSMPAFVLYDQNLKPFSATRQVKPGVSVCVFYYDADCDHCQYEATQIGNHIADFKNMQIFMVSTNPPAATKIFSSSYKLAQYPFITWLYDKDYNFYNWFGQAVTPSVYIYNKEHQLIKAYTGEVKIEALVKYLQNAKES